MPGAAPPGGPLSRRDLLAALLTGLAAGCAAAVKPPPAPTPAPALPLEVGPLAELLAASRLRWLLLARPRDVTAIPWLIPSIGAVVAEASFDRFAATTGVDLRQLSEAVLAVYADAPGAPRADDGEATLYLARYAGDPANLEHLFLARLTAGQHRTLERPDLVRVSGKIGSSQATLLLLGRDVVGLQRGGSATRGPARVAELYAEGKLRRSPTALAEEPLRGLAARLGPAPVVAFAVGPFEGELARGAGGLLAGATAIGAAARPSAREGVALAIAVAGDFSKSGEAASHELAAAWRDLAGGTFGHLLGLDQPIEAPLSTHAPDAVALAIELSPAKLAHGLAAATSSRLDEIMR